LFTFLKFGTHPPSPAQLAHLAQQAANTSASLNASTMPQLQQLSGIVNDISGQLALGRNAQAQLQIDQLGNSLNGLPEISLPELPERPGAPDLDRDGPKRN
jgi:hypothetical protein